VETKSGIDHCYPERYRAPDFGSKIEESSQAQILIPLVASLAFGLLTATIASLFFVPAFFVFLDELQLLKIKD